MLVEVAASPDLTILPVLLAAGAVRPATAIGTLIAIAGYQLRDVITAAVFLIIGVLVAGSIIEADKLAVLLARRGSGDSILR